MTVADAEEAIQFVNSREKPLAMYIFSKNQDVVDKFLKKTSAGGVTVNDTVMHASGKTMVFHLLL